ncbi:hypothetical protein Mgra_00000743 [Meloidogyne graminicola]|uniref:Uncharacterized protein n=1 Tax=Meloidogyne graminicola TaxID=189291 RepID=A0A8T0A4G5_9BILA|nr:hypothetical protein Mgra_00000743 [Meloidogyne graminicola]
MNQSFASQLYFPQISERSQKLFLSKLFIFAFIFEVLNNCIILADNEQKLSDHETPNLKVFQQKNTPDNFNIGVIHVKLKNWTTTRFPRISNKFHFILNETDNLEQLNKRRRNNNEIGESRGRRTEGSQPNRGNNEGSSSSGRMEMDAIFPYLLLALGLALVIFFVILYAILNALLQRKDQHDSERRRKRKKRKRRRGRRGWRNDNNLIDREKQFEDDEENSSEEKHIDSIEEEGSNNLSRPVARWHRSRDGQLSPLEVDDENGTK